MDTNSNELFQNRPCNECNSLDNIEIITIGENGIALCMDCRNKLRKILGIEQPTGIELRNIDLAGLTIIDELLKADEEETEFKQALIGYLQDRHEVSREHLLEELCDTIQVKLSTMKTIDIDIEEITEYWNTKHLEKIKDRPRKEN